MTERNNKQPVNRNYKSRLFTMIYKDKSRLLELYNAVSGKHYRDPELLEINTLENAIYMTMQNDVSFLIDSRLSLYEHQSTVNPNLPLRYLFYISDLYSDMTKNKNLYGTKLIELPQPKFLIFYNGLEEQPERQVLRLSDAYERAEENPSLELEAVLLNINPGYNEELKAMCKSLADYTEYITKIRKYKETMPLEDAVELAITECIKEGILEDFLIKNRAEAKHVSIYEYDQEKHIQMERKDAYEDGIEKGIESGRFEHLREQIEKKQRKGKTPSQIAEELEEDEQTIVQIIKENN